jgi:hypothetical protein
LVQMVEIGNQLCKGLKGLFSKTYDGPLGLWAVLIFSFVLLGSLFVVRLSADVNWDGVFLIAAAKSFANDGLKASFTAWPKFPLYPLLIAIFQAFIPDWVAAGRILSLVTIMFSLAGISKIAHYLFGRKTALLSAILFVLIPETILQSNSVNRDPVFLALFVWAIYFLQKSISSHNTFHFAAGFVLSLTSCLIRAEGATVLVGYAIILFVASFQDRDSGKVYNKFLISLIAISSVLAILLRVLFELNPDIYKQIEAFFLDYNKLNITDSHTRIYLHLKRLNDTTPSTNVGVHFGSVAGSMILLIFALGLAKILAVTISVPNVILLLLGIKNCNRSLSSSLIITIGVFYLAILYLYFVWFDLMLTRWMLPVIGILSPWAGYGLVWVMDYTRKWKHHHIICGCILISLFVYSCSSIDKFFKKDDMLAKSAGEWILKQGYFYKSNTVFNDPVVAFYAGMDPFATKGEAANLYLQIDESNLNGIESFSDSLKADFIVIYTRKDRENSIVPFTTYFNIKKFENRNHCVLMYCINSKLGEIPVK